MDGGGMGAARESLADHVVSVFRKERGVSRVGI